MTVPINGLLLFAFVITFHRTTCQFFPSQQGDEESLNPERNPGEWYPGPGGPGAGEGGLYPPSPRGPGGSYPGAMGPGQGFPPFGSEGQKPMPSFVEGGGAGEGGASPPSDFDPNIGIPSLPDRRGDPEWPYTGTAIDPSDWPQPSMGDNTGLASHSSVGPGPFSGLGAGEGLGPSINDGTQPGDHNDAADMAGTDANGSKGNTNSELTLGEKELVKSHGIRQNMTAAGTHDDNFNYVGMYITVAVFITFMVTLVAIALIRGPQGPFKTKRTEEEIARGLNIGGPVAGDVITLSDGVTTRTDAQWEQQPLRGECDDAVTDVQVSCGDTAVACEGSTTVAVNEISSKEEGV